MTTIPQRVHRPTHTQTTSSIIDCAVYSTLLFQSIKIITDTEQMLINKYLIRKSAWFVSVPNHPKVNF